MLCRLIASDMIQFKRRNQSMSSSDFDRNIFENSISLVKHFYLEKNRKNIRARGKIINKRALKNPHFNVSEYVRRISPCSSCRLFAGDILQLILFIMTGMTDRSLTQSDRNACARVFGPDTAQ